MSWFFHGFSPSLHLPPLFPAGGGAWASLPVARLHLVAQEAPRAVPAGTEDQGGQQGQADDGLKSMVA